MITPSLNDLQEIRKQGIYRTAPVSMEILSDIKTPIEVLKILKNVSDHCYLLESVADNEKWGRYTFLGYDPSLEITCLNGQMKIGSLTFETTDPGSYIRQVVADHKSPKFDYLPSFTGGLVGYFSYDYIKYSEPKLELKDKEQQDFRDLDLMLFNDVIAFDHYRQKVLLITGVMTDDLEKSYKQACEKLEEMTVLKPAGLFFQKTY